MAYIVEVIEPDGRTADRTPRIKWEYTGYQAGYKLQLIKEKTASPEVVLDITRSNDSTTKQYNLQKVGSSPDLDYGTYNVCVFVKNSAGAWQNMPTQVFSYSREGGRATVGFTTGTVFSVEEGDPVYLYGLNNSFTGIFWIATGGGLTLGYTDTREDYELWYPTTGYVAKGAQVAFEIVPTSEKVYSWQENKGTTGNASVLLLTATEAGTGAYRVDNKVTYTTVDSHGLTAGNYVYVYGTTGGIDRNFDGLFKVVNAPSAQQFTVYQYGENAYNGTGGYVTDMGFEDWPTTLDVDITSNPQGVRIAATGISDSIYATPGIYKLIKTTNTSNTQWGYVVYQSDAPDGTSVEVVARTADTEDALESAGWSAPLKSGDSINKEGRVLELRITLTTSSVTRTITPTIRDVMVSYYTPALASGDLVYAWHEFSETFPEFNYYLNTRSVPYGTSGTYSTCGVGLTVDHEDHEYASPGYIILRHDSVGLNDWNGVRVYGALPTETGSTLQVAYKVFNKLNLAEDTAWSTPTSFTANSASPFCLTFGNATIGNKRYMDVKVTFDASYDKAGTPEVTKVEFDWTKKVDPKSLYFFTEYCYIPSDLVSIILTANTQEPDGCSIYYGVNFDDSTDFSRYTQISKNQLVELIAGGRYPKIGVELLSGSILSGIDDIPILHEMAYQMNTEDKDVFIPNEDIT